VSRNVVADSGFWFGLFNARDQYHQQACAIERLVTHHNLVIPWLSLYESLNTRLVRNRAWRARMAAFVRRPSTVLLDDSAYRQVSLDHVLAQGSTTFSLVDHVIRSLLEDPKVAVHELITFNAADFVDVCQARHIEIIDL
jgi:predicted nucleic acid-binding protein